jgi:hypothetical protein
MKWFKHDCDMHTDLKVQILVDKHGIEGYAIFNLCLEMVGKEGKKGKIEGQLRWRQLLLKIAQWSDEGKLNKIIETMAEVKLICSKALKYDNLYIPKFIKRADDYTLRQLRTNYGQTTDNVHVDKNRLDKIIEEYIKIKRWDIDNKELMHEVYKRNVKPAKQLALIAKDDDLKVIRQISSYLEQKGLSWTLETIIKQYPEWSKPKPKQKYRML